SIYSVPLEDLPEHESEKTTVMAKAIWGLRARVDLPVRHLDKGVCSIATYLEKFLGIGFPQALPILYPSFTVAVRRAMRKIVVQSQAEQRQITAEEASTFFLTEFQSLRMGQSPHPHQKLYDQTGATFSQMFAAAYQPHKGAVKFLHWLEGGELILNWDEEL